MEDADLKTYAMLAQLGFPKSYQGKILLVTFLGTQVPLVAMVLYLLFVTPSVVSKHPGSLAVLLVITLLGVVATVWVLHALLAPVRLASSCLRGYLDEQQMPQLPIGYSDEAGRLMADVRDTVENLDTTIRSLEETSGTDHLTGLLNRRQGEKRLAEEAARTKRSAEALTIALVDVDHFKTINDTYGHQAGDACIRHVARVIQRNIRQSDWLARWGGDEFVLALHDASMFASPEAVLQRIVADLKRSPVQLPQGIELVLGVSIGAKRSSSEDEVPDLLEKADEAMYEAKRERRAWVLAK